MKNTLFLLLIFLSASMHAQTTLNDTEVVFTNPELNEKITLKLDTERFVKDDRIAYSYVSTDGNMSLRLLGAAYVEFEDAVSNVTKKYGENNVTIIEEGRIMRAIKVEKRQQNPNAQLYYGIASGDGRVISIIVYLPEVQLQDFKHYFDNVALSMTIGSL